MTAVHPQLSGLFERAAALPIAARAAFLDAECGDATLRRELESLLVAHDSAGEFFDRMSAGLGLSPTDDATANRSDLSVTLGRDLGGSYRIERELGGGGMSRVFLAEEVALGRRVVIKTLPGEMAAAVSIDRFRREIAVIAQLQHPHVVPLLAANSTSTLLYYTMPFVAGESLRSRIMAGGALPLDDALRIWRDVLEALAHAHANGVIHRDIKPANILLSGRSAMVTDFGIARAIERATHDTRATVTGPLGTPAYMAPEQATGRIVDRRTDLYAAGLVMFEMLAGRSPFQAASAREYLLAHVNRAPEPLVRDDVPPRLAALVMQCLAKNPDGRPTSADDILGELDALVLRPTGHSRPILWALAGAAVLALTAAGLLSWRGGTTRAPSTPPPIARLAHVPSDSARRLYERGLAEQRRRTREGGVAALGLFGRAIAADSDFSNAWAAVARTAQFANLRGWTLAGSGPDSLLALAVRASRHAVELDSGSAEAWTILGKVAGSVDLEDRGATIHALRRALALDSTYAEAWFELGLAQEESLQPREALQSWLTAARLSPTNTQVLAFLGYHGLWYGDFPSGVRWVDSAVAVDPTYFLARDAAAFLAIAMNRPDVAARHAEAVLRTRGHEPFAPYGVLAMAAAMRGDLARARQYGRQAESLVIDPGRPTKHEAAFLAMAWSTVGDTARAVRWAAAYSPRGDLHFQLHLKREPALRWFARSHPELLR